MIRLIMFVWLASNVASASPAGCKVMNLTDILKGCDLNGLTVTTRRGSIVDDSNCGVLLPKSEFTTEPVFKMIRAESNDFYSIVMVDPDAPGHKDGQFFLHMIKTNVPGYTLKDGKTGGDELMSYRKPTPPRGTGAHRYISLVYKQDGGSSFSPELPAERGKFNLATWLRGKDLCGPLAANQFTAEF